MRYFLDLIIPEGEAVAEIAKEPSVLPYVLGIGIGAVAVVLIVKAIGNKK